MAEEIKVPWVMLSFVLILGVLGVATADIANDQSTRFHWVLSMCEKYGTHLYQVPNRFKVACSLPDRNDDQFTNQNGDFTGNIREMFVPEKRHT